MLSVKRNGAHKNMIDGYVKVNGVWKQAIEILTKKNGQWEKGWLSDIIGLNVTHTTSSMYDIFEDTFSRMSDPITIKNLVVKVYNGSGSLIHTETIDEATFWSISYNINGMASLGITVNVSQKTIQYSVDIDTSTDARKVSFTIGRITLN